MGPSPQSKRVFVGVAYVVIVIVASILASSAGPGWRTAGAVAVVLTLPWSVLQVLVFDIIDPTLMDTVTVPAAVILSMVEALLNVGVAYLVVRVVGARSQRVL